MVVKSNHGLCLREEIRKKKSWGLNYMGVLT